LQVSWTLSWLFRLIYGNPPLHKPLRATAATPFCSFTSCLTSCGRRQSDTSVLIFATYNSPANARASMLSNSASSRAAQNIGGFPEIGFQCWEVNNIVK
jgi:hypothetical protein